MRVGKVLRYTVVDAVVLLSAILNVLNYSPLAWDVFGLNISYLRAPLIGVFILWFLILSRRNFRVLKKCPPIVWMLPASAILSGFAMLPQIQPLAYGIWLLAATAATYFFLETKGDIKASFESTIKVLFIANIVPVLAGIAALPQYIARQQVRLLALGEMDQFNSIAAVVVFVSGYWILKDRLWISLAARAFVLLLMAAAIPNIAFSGTRTALVGTIMFFLAVAILSDASRRRWSSVAGIAILLFGFWIVTLNYVNDSTLDRISESVGSSNSIQTRQNIALANWQMALDYPIAGVGLTNSKNLIESYGGVDVENFSPHSTPIGVFSELGAIGLIVFMALTLNSFTRGWYRWAKRGMRVRYFSIFLPVFAMCLFEYNLSPGQFLFFPLFLLLLLPHVRYLSRTIDNRGSVNAKH